MLKFFASRKLIFFLAIFWHVWYSRDQAIFEGKPIKQRTCNGLNSKCVDNSIEDLMILTSLSMFDWPRHIQGIVLIYWHTPLPG